MVGFKKGKKRAIGLTKAALVTGIGANVVTGVGAPGQVGVNVATGLTAFSRGFPAVGSILGAELVLGSLKPLTRKRRRR